MVAASPKTLSGKEARPLQTRCKCESSVHPIIDDGALEDQMFNRSKAMALVSAAATAFSFALMGVSLANAQGTPGQFVVEPPTLTSIGVEWYIQPGEDPLRHSWVTVQYRKVGSTDPFSQGMNLLRIQNEVNAQATGIGTYTAPNMFAGSILDLEANTAYEVSMTMH